MTFHASVGKGLSYGGFFVVVVLSCRRDVLEGVSGGYMLASVPLGSGVGRRLLGKVSCIELKH